jgi:hypothetical protein
MIGNSTFDSVQYVPIAGNSDFINISYSKAGGSMNGVIVDFQCGINTFTVQYG